MKSNLSRNLIARSLVCFTLLVMSVFAISEAHASATYMLAYPSAPYHSASGTFTLKADSTTIPVEDLFGGRYSFGHLAFQGTTTFTLTVKSGAAITSYNISPHAFGVTGSKSGSTLTFSVTQAKSTYLIITISTSAGALKPMVIAGDPQETNIPTIGGTVHDITASPYNADKTGNTLLTTTIQNAVNAVSSAGGGTVYFPAGVYEISNNIQMKSNVTVYLAAGAFLHGSPNRSDYVWAAGNPSPGGPQNFMIEGAVNNVAITGRGVIDANSTILVTPQNPGGPIDGWGYYRKGIIHSAADTSGNRPNGITISGITVRDSSSWTFNIGDARNVTIQNVKMLNDFNWVHSDGYDIVDTDTATIDNCLGVTGDDVFDAKAQDANPVTNITYSNNVAYSNEGAGTKIGMQATGTASNIVFSNIQVVNGYRAVSVSHDSGTASWSNIHFNDIHMENIVGSSNSGQFQVSPIVVWTLSGGAGPVSNVSLSRVTIDNSRGFKGQISGTNSTGNVSNVTLQDVTIDGVAITSSNASSKINIGSNVSSLHYGLVSGAVYSLASVYNGLGMDNGNTTTNGSPVIQWTVNSPETSSQQWKLTSTGGSNYTIVSQKSGLALDNSNSGMSPFGLVQSTPNGNMQQQWAITSLGSGLYKVISAQSTEALDDNHTQSNNSQVVQYTYNGGTTQQWKLTKQ